MDLDKPPFFGTWTQERVRDRIAALGPWFHHMRVGGVWTAPEHFLGDYPAVKWRHYEDALPRDMRGKTVLDIGCNAGFFSQAMKRRGADRVLGIDFDDRYLAQARFAAEVEGLDIEFRRLSVYDVAVLRERFDVVFFIGVFYHLRHPLLALDLVHAHVARDLLIFQTMQRGSTAIAPVADDYDFNAPAPFDDPGYPKLHFIEKSYAHDPTNWWAANRACTEAMLRSAGFSILSRPEDETYLCRRVDRTDAAYGPVYPARGEDEA
jgi:tRNA (mo5U34)-methyltransferase